MRKILFLLLISTLSFGQSKLFKNVNNEVCLELRTINDPVGAYIVYVVFEDDSYQEVYKAWQTLKTDKQRSDFEENLKNQGARIEAERLPIVRYPVIDRPKNTNEMLKPMR
jgi:hypothetical protein